MHQHSSQFKGYLQLDLGSSVDMLLGGQTDFSSQLTWVNNLMAQDSIPISLNYARC